MYKMEIGRVGDLITSMMVKGASEDEMSRIIEYSRAVMDAEKYALDCERSKKSNNIGELEKKYSEI